MSQIPENFIRTRRFESSPSSTDVLNSVSVKNGKTTISSSNRSDIRYGINEILKRVRQKKKIEKDILDPKVKIATSKLIELSNDLNNQIEELKLELVRKNIFSKEQILRIVNLAVEQPQVPIEKIITQIEITPSVITETELVKIPSNEELSGVIDNVQKTIKNESSKLPNWLLPALVVGGVAYLIFRK